MQFPKALITFTCIWFFSSVAFSNGLIAPELAIVSQAKSSAEYPILRRLQDLTLDLQMLEITLKNRRDLQTENKISTAMKEIETEGALLSSRYRTIRGEQVEAIAELINTARRYKDLSGVQDAEWDELLTSLRSDAITNGTLVVHGKIGTLNVLNLNPLYIGRQAVWSVSLPAFDSKSFWLNARHRANILRLKTRARALAPETLATQITRINLPFSGAETLAKTYFNVSYTKLYNAFETHRFAILQRVQLARKALIELGKTNSAMGSSEQYGTLYNQALESLFSYGVDLSLSGTQRDFAFKGFLFAENPEQAQELLRKLKFTASPASYNSPSS